MEPLHGSLIPYLSSKNGCKITANFNIRKGQFVFKNYLKVEFK